MSQRSLLPETKEPTFRDVYGPRTKDGYQLVTNNQITFVDVDTYAKDTEGSFEPLEFRPDNPADNKLRDTTVVYGGKLLKLQYYEPASHVVRSLLPSGFEERTPFAKTFEGDGVTAERISAHLTNLNSEMKRYGTALKSDFTKRHLIASRRCFIRGTETCYVTTAFLARLIKDGKELASSAVSGQSLSAPSTKAPVPPGSTRSRDPPKRLQHPGPKPAVPSASSSSSQRYPPGSVYSQPHSHQPRPTDTFQPQGQMYNNNVSGGPANSHQGYGQYPSNQSAFGHAPPSMYPIQTVSDAPNYGPPLVGSSYGFGEGLPAPVTTPYGYPATGSQGFYPGADRYYGGQRAPLHTLTTGRSYPQSDASCFDPNNQGPPPGYYLGPDGHYYLR